MSACASYFHRQYFLFQICGSSAMLGKGMYDSPDKYDTEQYSLEWQIHLYELLWPHPLFSICSVSSSLMF